MFTLKVLASPIFSSHTITAFCKCSLQTIGRVIQNILLFYLTKVFIIHLCLKFWHGTNVLDVTLVMHDHVAIMVNWYYHVWYPSSSLHDRRNVIEPFINPYKTVWGVKAHTLMVAGWPKRSSVNLHSIVLPNNQKCVSVDWNRIVRTEFESWELNVQVYGVEFSV